MSMRYLLIFLLLSSVAYAQATVGYLGTIPITGPAPVFGASLTPVLLKHTWNYVGQGFCARDSQCLVSNLYNPVHDDSPLAYFMGAAPATKPKCIDSEQYILDHYCRDQEWSSRTRRVAEQLLALAYSSIAGAVPDEFELFCDSYDRVLNEYDYFTQYGLAEKFIKYPWCKIGSVSVPCANHFCVLKYPGGIAFGASLNVPIDDSEDSFLFALNKSEDFCNNAFAGDTFASCGDNIFYNEALNAVIYSSESLPAPTLSVYSALDDMFANVQAYAFDYVHNPSFSTTDYSFLNLTPSFDRVFVGLNNNLFGFSLKTEDITDLHVDYAGWHFLNVDIHDENYTCSHYFRKDFAGSYDPRVNCMPQPYLDNFFVVAFTGPPLFGSDPPSVVDEWPQFTGGLRIS